MNVRRFWAVTVVLVAVTVVAPVAAQRPGKGKRPGRPGEVNTPPAFGERVRTKLKVGDVAPDFSLPRLRGEGQVKLSSFRGKRPVVLIFGSYT